MKICIIAEKPSVARDIARIVGANKQENGFFSGNDYLVTWAFGHLITLAMPDEYGFEKYNADELPITPDPFRLTVRKIRKGKEYVSDPSALKQLKTIRSCFDNSSRIIVATDAGREGELIFRYIYTYLNCQKPFDRLWISSLTDKAIREGFQNLKDGSKYDNLYYSGKARSQADWLVGINASRALSISAKKGGYSLGRVQTPTLSMICKRFIENKDFSSVPYWQIKLLIEKDGVDCQAISDIKFDNSDTARSICETYFSNETSYLSVSKVNQKVLYTDAPLLYDLTSLQKEANRKYGFSADKTLNIAQGLYEKKHITYPRTGSRYIGEDILEEIPSLIKHLHNHPLLGSYATLLSEETLNKRSVNAAKVTDHHALLITDNSPGKLTPDEQIIYERIAARMLEAFSERSSQEVQQVELTTGEHIFKMKNSRMLNLGWKSVLNEKDDNNSDDNPSDLMQNELPKFYEGEIVSVKSNSITESKTNPKPLYNEATLLSAMETAGRDIDDKATRDAMKDCGLGTPATRANIIETLILRDYITREKKSIIPTEKGLLVYDVVKDKKISDAEMTGSWEKTLTDIEQGEMNADTFHKGIEVYTKQICQELLSITFSVNTAPLMTCPKCNEDNLILYPKVAKCTQCGFLVFRQICGLMLSDEQVKSLINDRKTPLLKGLISKSGKKFNARLVLNDDFTTSFLFDPKS